MSSSLVQVELRSRVLPTISWELDGASSSASSSGPGFGAMIGRWLKPAVRVSTPLGDFTRRPYGEPGPSSWPLVPLLVGGVLLVVLSLAAVGLRTVTRRR